MPHLHVLLVEPRFTYVAQANRLVHRIWFEGRFAQSELVTEDHEESHHLAACRVIFTENSETFVNGELKYEAAWREPETAKVYPGTCEFTFSASAPFMGFLDSYASRGMELHMLVFIDAKHPVVHRLGNDVAWFPIHQNPLPSKMESIGFVPTVERP